MPRIDRHRLVWLAALAACVLTSCKPKSIADLLQPSEALGQVLSEEAIRAAGPKKQVAVITHDTAWGEPSTVEEAFRSAVKKHGFTVVTAKAANLGDPMGSAPVGLKLADFSDALAQSADAGVVVSFVGGPLFNNPEELARVAQPHPPVLVVATARQGTQIGVPTQVTRLAALLDAKVIQAAIIDGADPGASGAANADATHQIFAQNYRLLHRPD